MEKAAIDIIKTLENLNKEFPRFQLSTLLKIVECIEEKNKIDNDWYKPYYGHINYFALYDGKDNYYKGTCFVMDVDLLRPATQEEKDLILKLAADEGYTWNDDTKRLIGLYNKSEKI